MGARSAGTGARPSRWDELSGAALRSWIWRSGSQGGRCDSSGRGLTAGAGRGHGYGLRVVRCGGAREGCDHQPRLARHPHGSVAWSVIAGPLDHVQWAVLGRAGQGSRDVRSLSKSPSGRAARPSRCDTRVVRNTPRVRISALPPWAAPQTAATSMVPSGWAQLCDHCWAAPVRQAGVRRPGGPAPVASRPGPHEHHVPRVAVTRRGARWAWVRPRPAPLLAGAVRRWPGSPARAAGAPPVCSPGRPGWARSPRSPPWSGRRGSRCPGLRGR